MGTNNTDVTDTQAMLKQLRVIAKILLITNSESIESELVKLASTYDRKRWWVLFDGERSVADVARLTGKTERAVSYFVKDAADAGFLETQSRRPPTRALDYVPPKWLELVKGITDAEGMVAAPSPQALPEPSQKRLPLDSTGEEPFVRP
jgi:hypothetical protein